MGYKVYWRLIANSNDYSGNGYNGVDASILYDKGYARLRNPGNALITFPNAAIVRTNLTISFWTSSYGSLFGQGTDAIDGWGISLHDNFTSITMSIVTTVPSPVNYSAVANPITVANPDRTNWYNLTLVFDNTNKLLYAYFNSKLIVPPVATGSTLRGTQQATLGSIRLSSGPPSYALNGGLRDFIYENAIWPPSRIKNEYAKFKGFF